MELQEEAEEQGIVRTHAGDADDLRQTVATLERHLTEHPRLFGKHAVEVLGRARRILARAAETMEQAGPTLTYCDHPSVTAAAKMPAYGHEPDVRRDGGGFAFGRTCMSRLAPVIRTDIEPGS
jgi:hypothetical protein